MLCQTEKMALGTAAIGLKCAVVLAFVLAQDGVFAIPRASRVSHVQANCEAADVVLSAEELALLNEAFPAPNRKVPLDMI